MSRLKALTLLAFAFTLITLPFAAQAAPVAQGGVIYVDGIPQAFAVVFDGEEMISDAQVSINSTAMTSEEDGLYTMDLTGVQAGDTLVFRAEDSEGNLIYTSSGVIPAEVSMADSDQPTEAGAAYDIQWNGGSGAAAFGAGYADFEYGAVWSDYLAPSVTSLTVPATITYEGAAIFVAAAFSGDTQFLNLTETELQKRSYFLINRSAYIEASLVQ